VKVIFWGVRGSVPTPKLELLRYGGNTTCVQVIAGGKSFIIDSGTGIIELGRQGSHIGDDINILFTHLHHDHTQGFPFFTPAFRKGVTLRIQAGSFFRRKAEQVLTDTMAEPYFPVPLDRIGAEIIFEDIHLASYGATEKGLFNGSVDALRLFHPTEGVIVYAFNEGKKRVVFATDCEHYDGRDEYLIPFVENCDYFIHDTMYTDAEYNSPKSPKKGWGHSTIEYALEFAKRAKIKNLVCTHHEPIHNDDFLDAEFAKAKKVFRNTIGAKEGLEIEV
jgi:phosphoribosyl 1,2-cyclic phosphodiesterase